MPENFNIVSVNVNILDKEIDKWKLTHNYNPIIIISASTFQEIAISTMSAWYENTFLCDSGRTGRYKGLKVFFDPEKSHGDIELR